MMEIGSTLPAQNLHLFPARIAGCSRRGSPFTPTITACFSKNTLTATATTTTKLTRKHLSNLEKLLGTEPRVIRSDPKVAEVESVDNGSPENRGKGLLEGLNLPQIWPENKAAEEMSPRHLNRLQRLLSKNGIEYSPRNSLASRWREYHGSNNWAGLLDPLDENLRREMVRYGEFIQAAYHCFHSDPATSAVSPPSPRHVALPDKSYRVTKTLYATSSVGLPKWVDKLAPNLDWMTQRTSCVGYIAVCDDQKEISRMGRRDIVISLRGTATCLEWAENMRDLLVEVTGSTQQVMDLTGPTDSTQQVMDPLDPTQQFSGPTGPTDTARGPPKVQCGFLSLYRTVGAHVSSLSESIRTEIQRLTELYKGEDLSITVTGHSLGAALALLAADDIAGSGLNPSPPIAVYTFGGPRVGNRVFAGRLATRGVKVLRIVNSQDLITRVPGMFCNEDLDKKLRASKACRRVLDVVDASMPWAYAHVGTELRVDTRKSPYLRPDADVACCHDLEAYLHLVDGFLASNGPFRPNAKRSLVKLVHEQNSNVKKLYTSKAHGLKLNLERDVQIVSTTCLPSPS